MEMYTCKQGILVHGSTVPKVLAVSKSALQAGSRGNWLDYVQDIESMVERAGERAKDMSWRLRYSKSSHGGSGNFRDIA